jgi:hypothetical protein
VLIQPIGGKDEFESQRIPVDQTAMGVGNSPLPKATGKPLSVVVRFRRPIDFSGRWLADRGWAGRRARHFHHELSGKVTNLQEGLLSRVSAIEREAFLQKLILQLRRAR